MFQSTRPFILNTLFMTAQRLWKTENVGAFNFHETITLDNGSGFAEFKEIEEDLHTTVCFADPRSPWQRASNENLNDVIRFFYPKGFDFRNLSHEDLQAAVSLINNRTHKCLGFLSAKCCT